MGDGNTLLVFDNNEKTAGSKSLHLDNETPRSTIDEDSSTPAESTSPTRMAPLEVEELHRNTISSVNTPDQSSASLQSPRKQSITDETTSNPETPRRGRRNYREASDNEFGLPLGPAAGLGPQELSAPDGNQAIFSVRGTRSFKINRHRDSVTVFPSGCMGIKDSDDETPEAPMPVVEEAEPVVPQTPPAPATPSIVLARPASAARNPLTGEGYEAKDYERQTGVRKRATDGNPVLGQGYSAETRNMRPTKVPPGGFSQGLW